MNSASKNILIISPEPWKHVFVSKHHYAVHLAKAGHKVFFLNPPTDQMGAEPSDVENVTLVFYKGFLKGLRFFPRKLQQIFMRRVWRQLQNLIKHPLDIVWSFDNSVFFDFTIFEPNVITISHIVDLNQDFSFERAARTAKVCFAPTKFIIDKLKKLNPNSFFINHGVSILTHSNRSVQLSGSNIKKVCYAGNLDIQYMDWEVLRQLVHDHPEVDFYFAGPWKKQETRATLLARENVIYLGVLTIEQLYAVYAEMDALLVVYKANQFYKQLANPHKMMEYLASGKVIVSTYTEHYKNMDNLVIMSGLNSEYSDKFKMVINNLPFYNSPSKKEQRIAVSLDNTYDKQIQRIEEILLKIK